MKIAPHDWSGKSVASEVILEWGDEDVLILQVETTQVKARRGEGIELHVDHGMAALSAQTGPGFRVMASAAMTETEARQLYVELGQMLGEGR